MKKEIKARLEDIVALLNDPEEVVMEKEIKEKLEKIMVLLNNPEEAVAEKESEDKLEKVVTLVSSAMVDPDIDIEYCASGTLDDPYVLVTYIVSEYTKPTRKIRLGKAVLQGTPEKIANQVTFSIEEFKGEIDSVEMG